MSSEPLISRRLQKLYGSLDDVRGRRRSGLFVAEGTKCVLELAGTFAPERVYALREWEWEHGDTLCGCRVEEAAPADLKIISRLTTTPPVIAFFRLPDPTVAVSADAISTELILALDRIQDPGNLGTIIRCADWMGVHTIVASHDTVDAFSPKVVQATMGALARVQVVYVPSLSGWLGELPAATPVYGTFLDGENIYTQALSRTGVVVMGNEGSGISAEVEGAVNRRLYIPPYPAGAATVESLNVAVAAAITLSQFRSRQF